MCSAPLLLSTRINHTSTSYRFVDKESTGFRKESRRQSANFYVNKRAKYVLGKLFKENIFVDIILTLDENTRRITGSSLLHEKSLKIPTDFFSCRIFRIFCYLLGWRTNRTNIYGFCRNTRTNDREQLYNHYDSIKNL